MSALPFAARVSEGLRERGITLRELCRRARLDPSFFSKVLAGKRSPPAEEDVLRRIAAVLGLDPAELVVSAGRLPTEWRGVWKDRELFRDVHDLASRGRPSQPAAAASAEDMEGRRQPPLTGSWDRQRRAAPRRAPQPESLSEELL